MKNEIKMDELKAVNGGALASDSNETICELRRRLPQEDIISVKNKLSYKDIDETMKLLELRRRRDRILPCERTLK